MSDFQINLSEPPEFTIELLEIGDTFTIAVFESEGA